MIGQFGTYGSQVKYKDNLLFLPYHIQETTAPKGDASNFNTKWTKIQNISVGPIKLFHSS